MRALPSAATVRADFDRLAPFATNGWDHNHHYYPWLLRQVPKRCQAALDVGCGAGDFCRLLAPHAERVVGIDLSPAMIDRARVQSTGLPNVLFQTADLTTLALADDSFDCIVAIATLHHLPLAPTFAQLRAALRPGGRLLVLDLYADASWHDAVHHLLAAPASLLLRLLHRRFRPSPAERAAWAAHGAHDVYPTLPEVRAAAAGALPGAVVRRLLLWRYALRWDKPRHLGQRETWHQL